MNDLILDRLDYGIIKESYVKHCPGHKNTNGEDAEWCIVDHDDGKILSSHKTKEQAKSHLRDMKIHGRIDINFRNINNIDDLLNKFS